MAIPDDPDRPTNFTCRLSQGSNAFAHFWELTVGSDHAPIALRADWQAQLRRRHDELGFRYVRFHGLLSDDMGTLIVNQDKFLYSFFNIDQIFDFLLLIGMRPFVELSFMPAALASGGTTVFRYAGNVTPPKDYAQWAALIVRLVAHWAQRYDVAEVRDWLFEVWNEPKLNDFWIGTRSEYFDHYRHTVRAIKSVDAEFKVGGPATAKNAWVAEFVEFCSSNNLPVDFVSTHHYPTDALGHESDDTESQLAHSHRSILREQAVQAQRQARGRAPHYIEWNTSSNPRDALYDEPYAAAFVTKTVMEAQGLVQGYSFWTFSDIFAENYFPSVPFHGGFGLLSLHGIAKPMYRAFELLHRLGHEPLPVQGEHPTVDVWVVRNATGLTALASKHALPRHSIKTRRLRIALSAAPAPRSMVMERIDADHAKGGRKSQYPIFGRTTGRIAALLLACVARHTALGAPCTASRQRTQKRYIDHFRLPNAKALRQAMGCPEYLDDFQRQRLNDASALRPQAQAWSYDNGSVPIEFSVPPHGVAAITVVLADAMAEREAQP